MKPENVKMAYRSGTVVLKAELHLVRLVILICSCRPLLYRCCRLNAQKTCIINT